MVAGGACVEGGDRAEGGEGAEGGDGAEGDDGEPGAGRGRAGVCPLPACSDPFRQLSCPRYKVHWPLHSVWLLSRLGSGACTTTAARHGTVAS